MIDKSLSFLALLSVFVAPPSFQEGLVTSHPVEMPTIVEQLASIRGELKAASR